MSFPRGNTTQIITTTDPDFLEATRPVLEPSGYDVLSVANGSEAYPRGIAPEDPPCIFDEFYRAEDAKAMEGQGTGLAIVKRIVETYGGRVRVKSE